MTFRYRRTLASALAAIALCGAPAIADSLPALPSAEIVSDDALSQIRGKYVPPAPPASPRALAYRDALSSAPSAANAQAVPLSVGQSVATSPLSSIQSASGTVTYFGVQMVSSWNQTGPSGTQGAEVGLNLGFDLAHGTVSVGKWSSSTNGGLPTSTPSGTVAGPATSIVSSGVGQTIQVSGNGNAITNTATVVVNGPDSTILLPTTDTCGQQCSVTVGAGGAGIAITTPQGSVLQSIGPNGILQNAQVSSDMNNISNQLGVNVHMSQTPAFSAGSVLPIIQTITGLP